MIRDTSAQDQIVSSTPASAPRVNWLRYRWPALGTIALLAGIGWAVHAWSNASRSFDSNRVRIAEVKRGDLVRDIAADGRVTVHMGRPVFAPERVPFDASGLAPVPQGSGQKWPLALEGQAQEATVLVAVVSMGNPHAVQLVDDVDTAPVARTGPLVEGHARFPQRVNAGFLQIVSRSEVRLRVYERGAGETLACGSGACAAVAAGIRLGLLDARVDVHTRGGLLTIAWSGSPEDSVFMTGPATTVFEGQIDIPDAP